ncbi:MAG: hypothetical protein ABIG44_05795 [Planctomycetota bacterium]
MTVRTCGVVAVLIGVAAGGVARDVRTATWRAGNPTMLPGPGGNTGLSAVSPTMRITTECPAGETIFNQPAEGYYAAGVSDLQGGHKVFDNYSTYAAIEDIHWWGISAYYDDQWIECTPNNPETFLIEFWPDNGSGMPDTTVSPCSYNVSVSPVADGDWGSWNAYKYDVVLDPPCTLLDGWVSIQGNSDNNCWFLWVSGATNDFAYQGDQDGNDLELTDYDLGFCLTGQWVERFGACCDELTGNCYDEVSEQNCQGFAQRFAADTLCTNLDPSCEPPAPILGACCLDGICIGDFIEVECMYMGGGWYEGESCYGSPPFECPGPPECPDWGTLFAQSPSGPTEWQMAYTSDTYYDYVVYEDFFNLSGWIGSIDWWGLELEWTGAWSSCDDSDITFDIFFYPDAAGVPDIANPTCIYLNVPPLRTVRNDRLYDGHPLVGYRADLSECCCMVNGWLSIQGADGDACIFRWMDSRIGDEYSFQDTGAGPSQLGNNLSLCLGMCWSGPSGACCDDATGICTDYVPIDICVGPTMRFELWPATCAILNPPCGTGGCCLGYGCAPESPMTEEDCLATGGYYLGDGVACTNDFCDCGGTDYRGDANCLGDGANSYDIDAFIMAIGNREQWIATFPCDYYCANDTNCDGAVNAYDIDSFVWCVSQGYCDPCP